MTESSFYAWYNGGAYDVTNAGSYCVSGGNLCLQGGNSFSSDTNGPAYIEYGYPYEYLIVVACYNDWMDCLTNSGLYLTFIG